MVSQLVIYKESIHNQVIRFRVLCSVRCFVVVLLLVFKGFCGVWGFVVVLWWEIYIGIWLTDGK